MKTVPICGVLGERLERELDNPFVAVAPLVVGGDARLRARAPAIREALAQVL